MVGAAAALGALTAGSTALAVATMAVVGAAAGYSFAVSLRFSIAGLMVALSLLISQGLFLTPADAAPAFLFATAGGLAQAAFSLAIWAWEGTCRWLTTHRDGQLPARPANEPVWDWRGGVGDLRTNLTLRSTSARHALRFGASLAIGVAIYRALGMDEHGFWVPLTILFVLRPEEDETFHRLVLRAVGTLAAVLLADTLGEGALHAAGQCAYATAIGIAIAGAAFLVWSNPRSGKGPIEDAGLPPPHPAR